MDELRERIRTERIAKEVVRGVQDAVQERMRVVQTEPLKWWQESGRGWVMRVWMPEWVGRGKEWVLHGSTEHRANAAPLRLRVEEHLYEVRFVATAGDPIREPEIDLIVFPLDVAPGDIDNEMIRRQQGYRRRQNEKQVLVEAERLRRLQKMESERGG